MLKTSEEINLLLLQEGKALSHALYRGEVEVNAETKQAFIDLGDDYLAYLFVDFSDWSAFSEGMISQAMHVTWGTDHRFWVRVLEEIRLTEKEGENLD